MLEHMGTSLFVIIVVMTVIVATTTGLFAHGCSPRTLLTGIGFALLLLGLFLTGTSDLLVSGVESLIAWMNRTGWTNTMSWGAGIGGLGILLTAMARFLPGAKPRQDQEDGAPREQPAAQKPKAKPVVTRGGRQTTQTAHLVPKPGGTAPQKDAGGDEDLDEIEAILKKRRIVREILPRPWWFRVWPRLVRSG